MVKSYQISIIAILKLFLQTFIFSWVTSRVLSWSSLDWDRGRWNQLDLVIGTSFDIFTHMVNSYFLFQILNCDLTAVALYFIVEMVLVIGILFNPTSSWSNANKLDNAPMWVKDRIKPLTKEQRQEWEIVESLGSKLFGNN